jgi:hypothetical protein
MRTIRLLPALAAAAAVSLSATASAATITIDAPKRVNQWAPFVVTYKGDTNGETEDNRIVRVIAARGKKCPASVKTTLSRSNVSIGGQNVFHIGGFAGAEQSYFSTAGTYRLCGYLSAAGDLSTDVLFGESRKLTVVRHRIGNLPKAPTPATATWTASGSDIIGGTGATTVSFTISGKSVTSASLSGIPNTGCQPDWPGTPTPITGAATSTGPKYASIGTPVTGESFTVGFAADTGTIDLIGQSAGKKRIYGNVSITSADGSCRGGVGYVAHKQ